MKNALTAAIDAAYNQGFKDGVNLLHSRIIDADYHGNLVDRIAGMAKESVLKTMEDAEKLNEG